MEMFQTTYHLFLAVMYECILYIVYYFIALI